MSGIQIKICVAPLLDIQSRVDILYLRNALTTILGSLPVFT